MATVPPSPPPEEKNSLKADNILHEEEVSKNETCPIPRKPYVFTEKRKQNLAKANQTRLEKSSLKKSFRGQLDEMAKDLQTIYEKKVQEIINQGISASSTSSSELNSSSAPSPDSAMSSSSSSSAAQESSIPIERVEPKQKTRKRRPSYKDTSDTSSSDESEPPKRKPKPRKTKAREYISESSSEDEAPPKRKSFKSRRSSKKKHKKNSKSRKYHSRSDSEEVSEYSDTASDDEYEPSSKPRRPPPPSMNYGHITPGNLPYTGFSGGYRDRARGIYSGCTF